MKLIFYPYRGKLLLNYVSILFAAYPTLVIVRRLVLNSKKWKFQSARISEVPRWQFSDRKATSSRDIYIMSHLGGQGELVHRMRVLKQLEVSAAQLWSHPLCEHKIRI